MTKILVTALAVLLGMTTLSADAKHKKNTKPLITDKVDANGNLATSLIHQFSARRHRYRAARMTGVITSRKTGAKAYVSAKYASRFQGYVDDLEASGAQVKFMGGYRRGRCSDRHKHSCGMALDVCQLSRGSVDKRCNLPNRIVMGALAMKNGLFEGSWWCDNDFGHAQVGVSAEACRKTLYTAVIKMKETMLATVFGEDPEAKSYDMRTVVALNAEEPSLRIEKAKVVPERKRYAHRHHVRRHYASRRTRQTQVAYQYPQWGYQYQYSSRSKYRYRQTQMASYYPSY